MISSDLIWYDQIGPEHIQIWSICHQNLDPGSDLIWPDLTWPHLIWPDLTIPDQIWSIWSDLIGFSIPKECLPDLNRKDPADLIWHDLTWPHLIWPDRTWTYPDLIDLIRSDRIFNPKAMSSRSKSKGSGWDFLRRVGGGVNPSPEREEGLKADELP